MHKELILKTFKKAKEELEIKTGIIVSKQKLSEHISYRLFDDYKCQFGDKSLRILFKNASEEKNVSIKQFQVLNGLCNYLGYKNYIHFNSALKRKKTYTQYNVISFKETIFKSFKNRHFPKLCVHFNVSVKL
jgi:hypothetical protein